MSATNQPRRGLSAEGSNTGAFSGVDWLYLLGPAAIWGSSFALIRVGLDSFPPTVLTFMRLLFGFAALSVIPGVRRSVDRADWPRIAWLGILWMAVPLTMFSLAEQWVSSSTAGMINGATPITALIVASLALHRLPGRMQVAGIVVGFIGVVLISLPNLDRGHDSTIGVLLLLVAVSCYGIALNLAVPLQQRYGSLPIFWRAQMVALVLTLGPALVHAGDASPDLGGWLAVAVLGCLGTGLAYVLAGNLAGRVGGARASVITYLIPPWSIAVGVAFLSESVASVALLGTLIVLVGAFLTTRRDDRARQLQRERSDVGGPNPTAATDQPST